MIITTSGRPVGRFPLWKWTDHDGGFLLQLARIDVSDIGNDVHAEPFYLPLIKMYPGDGMTSIELRLRSRIAILFISKRRLQFHVTPSQTDE